MREAVVFHTEKEFREWFDKNYEQFNIAEIILSQEVCPDYVVKMKDGSVLKVEAELFAINFKYHNHDPSKADLIIACFAKESEVEGVPVIAVNKQWIYEYSPIEKLPPEGPLSDDELIMLSVISFHGSIELSSLAQKEFKGNNEIFIRVRPELIASFPRGKVDDNILNIISPKAKEYIKKYHHVLIGANFSNRACEAFESLSRRELIKIRPIPFIAAAHDGTIIDYEGWVPTEVYLTENAKKYHKQGIDKKVLNFINAPTKKD